MGTTSSPIFVNKTIKGILIPASADLHAHGISHLLLDDYRGIYLIHGCKKSSRMNALNRTRVEIQGLMIKPTSGDHPRMYVNNYRSADSYLNTVNWPTSVDMGEEESLQAP